MIGALITAFLVGVGIAVLIIVFLIVGAIKKRKGKG